MDWKDTMAVLWTNMMTGHTYYIGYIQRLDSKFERYKFKYVDDISKVVEQGFEPFREFAIVEGREQVEYETSRLTRFLTRVPCLKRDDVKRALKLHSIDITSVNKYDLLLIFGGRLATDNIATISNDYVLNLYFTLEDKKEGNTNISELLDVDRWQKYHQDTLELWTNYMISRCDR